MAACQHCCSVVWEPACDGQCESSSRHWSVVVVVIVIIVVGCLQAELTALRSQVEVVKRSLEECTVCLAAHEETEVALRSEATAVAATLQESAKDVELLHAKIGAW